MSLRDIERASIRAFLTEHAELFGTRRVLDYGCGRMPYRQLIEDAGGIYFGADMPDLPGSVVVDESSVVSLASLDGEKFDVIVCTQVLQYVNDPWEETYDMRTRLTPDGWLLMTGPINWPWIESDDRHRHTPTGVTAMLHAAGFSRVQVDVRASVKFEGEEWAIGWQAVARP